MSAVASRHRGLAAALRSMQARDLQFEAASRAVARSIEVLVRVRRGTPHLDEVRQEVCLKLLRTSSVFHGTADAQAVAYLSRVVTNVLRDEYRRERRREAHLTRARPDGADPIDRLPAPEPEQPGDTWSDREAAAEDLLDRLRAEIDHMISKSGKRVAARELAWRSAQATLLARVGSGMDARKIAIQLGTPDVSSDCIHKWVERGRPLVLSALDALSQTASPDEAEMIAKLRVALAKRRKDAGTPRPTRLERKPRRSATQ